VKIPLQNSLWDRFTAFLTAFNRSPMEETAISPPVLKIAQNPLEKQGRGRIRPLINRIVDLQGVNNEG
jgi:hypothetical protein